MKSAEYVELHKMISHLSEKSVWEALVAGKTLDQIKAGLPDEFYGFVDNTYKSIMDETMRITFEAGREVMRIKEQLGVTNLKAAPRKDVALAAKDSQFKKYIFLALDGKPIYPVALAASKPKTNKSLVNAEDI
jgi:RNA ligase